jgi:hypothetical protein
LGSFTNCFEVFLFSIICEIFTVNEHFLD